MNKTMMFEVPSFDTAVAEPGAGGGGSPSGAPPDASGGGTSGQPSGAGTAGSSTSTEARPTSSGQASAAAGEAEHEVVVDGQKVKVKLGELLSGYSRQSDYTKKTQALAAQQKQIETQRQEFERQRREWEEQQRRAAEPQGEVDPMAQLTQRQDAIEQRLQAEKLNSVLADVTKRYPSANAKLILAQAFEAKVQRWEDFESIAKQLHEEAEADRSSWIEKALSDENHPLVKTHWEKRLNAYLSSKAKGAKPAGETGSAGAPGGSAPQPPKNREEERDQALARLKNLNKL